MHGKELILLVMSLLLLCACKQEKPEIKSMKEPDKVDFTNKLGRFVYEEIVPGCGYVYHSYMNCKNIKSAGVRPVETIDYREGYNADGVKVRTTLCSECFNEQMYEDLKVWDDINKK